MQIENPGESSALDPMAGGVSDDDGWNTAALAKRPLPARSSLREENQALVELAATIATDPEALLQKLSDVAMRLCGAQGSGLSILEETSESACFRWRATSGVFADFGGQKISRMGSPCNVVMQSDAIQLLTYPARYYGFLKEIVNPPTEVLMVPFHLHGAPAGTLWVVSTDPGKFFNAEDARVLQNLSHFASATWQAVMGRREVEETKRSLAHEQRELGETQQALEASHERERAASAMFHAFFDQFPFDAVIVGRDRTVVDVGKTAVDASGFKKEDVVGKLFWETAWWRNAPESREAIKLGLNQAFAGDKYSATLLYHPAHDGPRQVDFAITPVFDEGAQVAFVIATGRDISDRVEAENELAAARKRLESALFAGEVGTYEWDVKTGLVHGDRNFARLFDIEFDERGAPVELFLAAIHPDDREAVSERLQHALSTGEEYRADYRILRRQRELWITARGQTSRDESGNAAMLHGVILDITDRKIAEKARAEAQKRFEQQARILDSVFTSIDDFVYLFDLQGRFQSVNRPLLALWGLKLDEVVGKNFFDIDYPPALAQLLMDQIQEVIRSKRPLSDETEYTSPAGNTGAYHYIFTPIFDSRGEVEFVAGVTRDVTGRKRREDRDRLLVAIDDATRPLTNADEITQTCARLLGQYLNVNRCAYADVEADENTVNLTGDFNVGVPSIVGRYQLSDFGDECRSALRSGRAFVVEDVETDWRTAPDRGSYRAIQARSLVSVPLQKLGKFVAAMGVQQSVPRKWQQSDLELVNLVANRCWESIERTRVMRELSDARARLEEHARELELRVIERTSRLQETVSELEAFSYSISHDLRGPLRVMRSFAQALEEDCGHQIDEIGAGYIRRIDTAAERMDRIIQDVLVYSRITRTELVLEPIDLNEFVRNLLEAYPEFHDKAAASIRISGLLPVVMGNKAALTQCFSNLIGNAVKFVRPGVFPCVEISGRVVGLRARVSIKDNGIGVEESMQEKIFGAFYRLDQAYPGTGIGLAIVAKAMDRMGGRVGLESGLGDGSVFYLDLAAACAE